MDEIAAGAAPPSSADGDRARDPASAAPAQGESPDLASATLPLQGVQIQAWPNGEFLIAGGNDRHLVAGKEIAAIVRALCESADARQAYARYRDDGGRLEEPRFRAHAARCLAALSSPPAADRPRLLWQRTVLRAERVATATRLARHAFALPWAAPCVLAALAAPVLAAGVFGERLAASWLSLGESLFAFALILLGTLIHEFGHAGALARHGQRAGAIGIGLYLGAIPVFYADVSRAWRLGVAARTAVNLGGIYFQSVYASALLLLGAAVDSPAMQMAGALSATLALTQFLPFARSDGYWLLSDLLGEPRLGRFEAHLLRDARRAGAAGRKARWRLAYLACNAAAVAAIVIVSCRHAAGLLRALVNSHATGIVSDLLRQPSRWLSLVLAAFLLYRLLAAVRRLANHTRSRRRPG